jgi:hypothetical protein
MDAGYSLKTDGKIPDCGSLTAVPALMPLAIREQQECVAATAAMS